MPVELPEPEVIDVQSLLASCLSGETEMICVLGPTASGKTRYAVQLARQLNRFEGALPPLPAHYAGFVRYPRGSRATDSAVKRLHPALRRALWGAPFYPWSGIPR